jgi:GMP synthase (glutamine-hydrolysing)
MKRALILQHVAHESPGRIRAALEAERVKVEVCRLDHGEPLPADLSYVDVLVVMGGPMGVGDLDDPRFPFLRGELALVQSAVSAKLPVLGICLGSQLLAHALGARVYPNELGEPPVRIREVGWGALALHHAADSQGLLRDLHDSEVMFHWHGDTFDLPAGAEWLASTLHCPRQMFRHGRSVGLQFHPELEESDIGMLLEADADYARLTLGPTAEAEINANTQRFFRRYRAVSDVLLGNVVRSLLTA